MPCHQGLDQRSASLSEDFILREVLPRFGHGIDSLYSRTDVETLGKIVWNWVSTEFDLATKPNHSLALLASNRTPRNRFFRGNPRRSFERQVKTFFLGFMAQHAESAGLAATRPLSPNWCAECIKVVVILLCFVSWGCWKHSLMWKLFISLRFALCFLPCWKRS